jgi:hypothetical protein
MPPPGTQDSELAQCSSEVQIEQDILPPAPDPGCSLPGSAFSVFISFALFESAILIKKLETPPSRAETLAHNCLLRARHGAVHWRSSINSRGNGGSPGC